MDPRRLCLTLVLPLALLAGCGGDPEPKLAPPSPSVSVSDVAVSPSSVPEAWEVQSEDGAEAFARHWIDELNKVADSQDTSALQAISTASCMSCTNIIEYSDAVFAQGGRIEGGRWRILMQSEVPPNAGLDRAFVSVRVRQASQRIVRPDGPSTVKPSTFTVAMTVDWLGDHWATSEAAIA